ncbi:hypothetical protein [Streptomyces sp. NBC_00728]|uniref:hypothetical protein n=1 Tax=Streptomyces sp. NBC_00728 TaxID=2903676 RepID=UPI003868555D
MTATRLGSPDLAVDALLMETGKNHYQPIGHCPQIGSLLPLYLPANGALLTAVSLMVAGWAGHSVSTRASPTTEPGTSLTKASCPGPAPPIRTNPPPGTAPKATS